MSLEKQIVAIIRTLHEEKRLGDKRAEQFYNLINAIEAGDKKVAVDSEAVAGYLGAASNDGVLRTGAPLSYTDNGYFITLDFAHLGLESLADPGDDRVLFWDESEGALKWLTVSTGLQVTLATLTSKDSEIDHDSLNNTHNLTTDIDHGSISGLDDDDHAAVYYTKTKIDSVIESLPVFLVADDNFVTKTPNGSRCIFIIFSVKAGTAYESAILICKNGAGPDITILSKATGCNIEVTTGPLDGTTGTNGKWTVSTHTDELIYIENRLGSDQYFEVIQLS